MGDGRHACSARPKAPAVCSGLARRRLVLDHGTAWVFRAGSVPNRVTFKSAVCVLMVHCELCVCVCVCVNVGQEARSVHAMHVKCAPAQSCLK